MTTTIHRPMVALALIGVALASGACAKKDDAATDTARTTIDTMASATAMPAPAPADPATYSDANILATEIAGDSAEVVLAGVAKSMATDPAVKAYATQLVADHEKGLKEAIALAGKLSITPAVPAGDTTSQGTAHMKTRLEGLAKGPAFDTVFVNHEIEDHQHDIDDANAMRGAAKDAQVKALVEKSIPELQKHLDRAKKLQAAAK